MESKKNDLTSTINFNFDNNKYNLKIDIHSDKIHIYINDLENIDLKYYKSYTLVEMQNLNDYFPFKRNITSILEVIKSKLDTNKYVVEVIDHHLFLKLIFNLDGVDLKYLIQISKIKVEHLEENQNKNNTTDLEIRQAKEEDIPMILNFIKELAEYEKLPHEVVATEDILRHSLFGERKYAEAIIGYINQQPVTFAIYFHNFSTFIGRPGLYLEDLYVKPEARKLGIGTKMFSYLAKIAKERNCGRFEWWVLDWNEKAIGFYKKLGAIAMDEWTVYRLTEEHIDKL